MITSWPPSPRHGQEHVAALPRGGGKGAAREGRVSSSSSSASAPRSKRVRRPGIVTVVGQVRSFQGSQVEGGVTETLALRNF